ncbi:tRNA 4-thiouridine(8) synthase ThiI [Candidatus Mcinerneyibacteriota bacterium]|nr:tRNA 4-thiouridine(8) synthase ThiI [Candidatus Mcinerneyibacteriota bacterium]
MDYLVSYGELALKGKNRRFFERKLLQSLKNIFKREKLSMEASFLYGKILVKSREEHRISEEVLKSVFGVAALRPVYSFPYDYERLKEELIPVLRPAVEAGSPRTFRITAKRAFKHFPVDSMAVARELGRLVLDHFPELQVDLTRPDLEITVDIRSEGFFVSLEKVKGIGGFPEGSQGRALLLLSGGIDSPVAGYLAMKRGLTLDFIYFHTPPFTGEGALNKVRSLAETLRRRGSRSRGNLYIADIAGLQKEIISQGKNDYATLLLRVAMLKMAGAWARQQGYDALVTGDSLGQVASQTIHSLAAVDAVAQAFTLRPLIGYDKTEIMALAESLGTMEISNRPFEDCCSLFVPEHPATRPGEAILRQESEKLPLGPYLETPDQFIRAERV